MIPVPAAGVGTGRTFWCGFFTAKQLFDSLVAGEIDRSGEVRLMDFGQAMQRFGSKLTAFGTCCIVEFRLHVFQDNLSFVLGNS